jgi:hypothetical protein
LDEVMAKDLFQSPDPADLIRPSKMPTFAERPARDVGLRKVGGKQPEQDINALLDSFPLAEQAAPAVQSKGWGQTLYEAAVTGTEQQGAGTAGLTSRNPATLARESADTKQFPPSAEQQDFERQTQAAAKGFSDAEGVGDSFKAALGILGVMARNPKNATGKIVESLSGSLPAFGAAAAGAAVGSAVPGIGTAVGAFTGYLLGNMAVNIQAEVGGAIDKELSQRGVDTNDPAAVERAIASDPYFPDIIREYGIKKGFWTGLTETAADVLTAGAFKIGKALVKPARSTPGRIAQGGAVGGAALVGQGASEGLGNVAGSMAVNEPVDSGQAMTEAAYGMAAGVPDAALAWKAAGSAPQPAPRPNTGDMGGAAADGESPNGGGPGGPGLLGGPAARPALEEGMPQARFIGAEGGGWMPQEVGGPGDVPRLPPPGPGGDLAAPPGRPALEQGAPSGPDFVVDEQGNVVPSTPEQRMDDQARADDMARPEAWMEGAVGRMEADDARRAAEMGMAGERFPGPAADERGIMPGDILFNGRRPYRFAAGLDARARKLGAEVVPVQGGYVLRPIRQTVTPAAQTPITGRPAPALAKPEPRLAPVAPAAPDPDAPAAVREGQLLPRVPGGQPGGDVRAVGHGEREGPARQSHDPLPRSDVPQERTGHRHAGRAGAGGGVPDAGRRGRPDRQRWDAQAGRHDPAGARRREDPACRRGRGGARAGDAERGRRLLRFRGRTVGVGRSGRGAAGARGHHGRGRGGAGGRCDRRRPGGIA